MSVRAAGRSQVTLLRDLSREMLATDWRAVSLSTCSIRSTPFRTTVDSRRCLPRRLCTRHLTRVSNSRLTGGVYASPFRIFAIAQKRTVASTWNLAELLLLQSDIVCENIYVMENLEICLILWRHCKRLLTERSRNFASLSKTHL